MLRSTAIATRAVPDAAIVLAPTPAKDDRLAAALAQILATLNSPESERAYKREWETYVAYLAGKGKSPLSVITLDVQTYLLELRAKGKRFNTRGRALAVIRAIYAALAQSGVLTGANPAREAKNPKGDSAEMKTPWIEEADLAKFLNAEPDEESFVERRDYLIALTLTFTGIRRAEVARVAIDDFEKLDEDGGILRVRAKGSKHGKVEIVGPLAQQMIGWAKEWGITTGALFRRSPKAMKCVGTGTVRNAVKRQAARAGFADHARFTPHAFRRSVATIAKARKVPTEVIQRGLLHSKKETTERYMKLADKPVAPASSFLDIMPKKLRKK
ncbi:MAG TPA: site-specific integrase [Gaiellaceae bacterium]|nr:site-specific integrase [Gaiellaceae bacterium]